MPKERYVLKDTKFAAEVAETTAKEKKVAAAALELLVEHVTDCINHPTDGLPSVISIPFTDGDITLRLHLDIMRIWDSEDPEVRKAPVRICSICEDYPCSCVA